jgi:hypothetical protein
MKKETTGQELKFHGISRITEGSVLLLGTVTLRDNSQEVWLECIDDNGDKVRLVPDLTGWQDGRKEVTVMNCGSGINTTAFFKKFWNTGAFVLHDDMMMAGEAAVKVLQRIPDPCLMWAILRAK